jgi:PST family polysaccharide transporter
MIKKYFEKIRKSEMVKTSFLTGIGTLIKQTSGIIVAKIIAITLGTSGVALVSQYIDFISISRSFATAGIQQGVVKYVAEFKNNKNEFAKILSTSLRITLFMTLFVGVILFIFSKYFSFVLFNTNDFQYIIRIFSFSIILFGLNILLIKILNGTGEIRKLVFVNIANSLFSLIMTTLGAYFFKLQGALISLSIAESIVFFISLFFVIKSNWFTIELFKFNIDIKHATALFKYTLMGITSMMLAPSIKILIRNYIITNISMNEAGIWSGLGRISNSYLSFLTLTLSYYYLPKFSSLKKASSIRQELLAGYKIIIPTLLTLIILIFVFRKYIILLIYTKDFLSMEKLFLPQLIGDFFKIISWLIAYLMLAKAKTVMFIGTEIIFGATYYYLSIYFASLFGIEGVVYAYTINYIIYTITLVFLLKQYIFAKKHE